MAGSKEIRNKIKSVQSTRKITKAMEMVAASKMKRAQDRMRAARPYVGRMLAIARHLALANPEYRHAFLVKRPAVTNVGLIVVTSDKGLCGGLNTNALRVALSKIFYWNRKEFERDGGTLVKFVSRYVADPATARWLAAYDNPPEFLEYDWAPNQP